METKENKGRRHLPCVQSAVEKGKKDVNKIHGPGWEPLYFADVCLLVLSGRRSFNPFSFITGSSCCFLFFLIELSSLLLSSSSSLALLRSHIPSKLIYIHIYIHTQTPTLRINNDKRVDK